MNENCNFVVHSLEKVTGTFLNILSTFTWLSPYLFVNHVLKIAAQFTQSISLFSNTTTNYTDNNIK
jgi:hypothetical protein